MKVGLFFGSFNPVHVGHMIIANWMVQHSDMDQLWMVLSPQNPFKKRNNLAQDYDRLHLLHLAIGDHSLIKASNVEFSLPKPSYTVDTLSYLHEKYPDNQFVLIMGGDNLSSFHKWKNYEQIIAHHDIYVYKRPGSIHDRWDDHPHIHILEAPLLHISASLIRKMISKGQSIQYMVPDAVYAHLQDNPIYSRLNAP